MENKRIQFKNPLATIEATDTVLVFRYDENGTSVGGYMSVEDLRAYVGSTTIVDNLTSTETLSALSANQGSVLKALIDAKIPVASIGAAEGVASLGSDGKVPSSQLPSYVDDVEEYDSFANFPTTGESSKIYVALDTSKIYRWGGTAYAEISASLVIGETTGTAYDGAKGKANAQAIATNAQNIATNATNINKKVDTTDIVDNLESTETNKPLSANQGNIISQKLTELENSIQTRIYGIDFDESTGDVTRLEDAVGLTIGTPDGTGAIDSDFDNIYPWSDIRHVKVEDDGTIIEQSDDDYATSDGEIMTYIPQFYYKDYRDNGHRYCYIANKQLTGYSKAWQDKEYGLIGSFPASYDTDYHSKYGEPLKVNTSYTDFLTGFYAKGDGKWSMYDANMMHNLFLLSCIEGGSLNHKAMYGRGINSGMPYSSSDDYKVVVASTNANTVTLDSLGQPFYVGMLVQIGTSYTNNSIASNRYITDISDDGTYLTITVDGDSFSTSVGDFIATWGQPVPQSQYETMGDGSGYILQYESENRSHVCYRGIWDLWGNIWQFNAGFMRYDGQYYGCTDKTKYKVTDPRSADGWVDLGIGGYADNGYQQIRESVDIDGGSIDVPIEWGNVASSETFYSAYLYSFSSNYAGARVLRLGGYWVDGSFVSLVCSIGSLSPSISVVSAGSRLIR